MISNEKIEIIKNKWAIDPSKEHTKKKENILKKKTLEILYSKYDNYNDMINSPEMKKRMEMNLGYFMQDIFGSFVNHENYYESHETGLDGFNKKHNIMYEVKLDANTTNSSSLDACIQKLKAAEKKHGCTGKIIQVFRTTNVTNRNKYSKYIISGDDYIKRYVDDFIDLKNLIETISI